PLTPMPTSTPFTYTTLFRSSEGATHFGIIPLDASGHASLQISTLTVGTHTITATYQGTSAFATSSNTTSQVVNSLPPATTSTTVSGSPNASTLVTNVTLTAV